MKKISFIFAIVMIFASSTVKSQVTTYPDGKIAINTNSTPLSDISINSRGLTNFYVFLQTPDKSALTARSTGTNATGWRYAGELSNYSSGSGFLVGVRGDVHPENYQENNSGRAYGVYAAAGYATTGWNYGVFGRLSGSHNGTGIYGSSNSSDNGIYIDGRYAGYFNGLTKVAGSLIVTGNISGTMLSKAVDSSEAINIESYSCEKTNLEKLATMKAITFYKKQPTLLAQESDTIADIHQLTNIEIQNYEKLHYALPIEQLEEVFPNLVYENEDGSKSVNYIELIPILVQSINELKAEITSLKKVTNSITQSNKSDRNISLSIDGKCIGLKRKNKTFF